MKTYSAIRETARQFLRDEFKADEDMAFENDELDLHIDEVLREVSQRSPYEAKETVVADGTSEIDLSAIEGLIGDKVERVEYPVGNTPRTFLEDWEIFGNTLTLTSEPTTGEDIYLYCQEVHVVTESSSTLDDILEKVVIEGVVAKAAQAWLNQMREQIVPQSQRWYHTWVTQQLAIYNANLNSIARPRVWEY